MAKQKRMTLTFSKFYVQYVYIPGFKLSRTYLQCIVSAAQKFPYLPLSPLLLSSFFLPHPSSVLYSVTSLGSIYFL